MEAGVAQASMLEQKGPGFKNPSQLSLQISLGNLYRSTFQASPALATQP